jgi:hypothetical protein
MGLYDGFPIVGGHDPPQRGMSVNLLSIDLSTDQEKVSDFNRDEEENPFPFG